MMIVEAVYFAFLIYIIIRLLNKLRPKSVVSPDGKAVLITGCDSGFGNQLAHRLNKNGFKIYATVLSTDSLGAQELKTNAVFADKMIVLQMNVTNDREVNEVYERVKGDLQNSGHVLWTVVNNAGIISSCPIEWGTMDNYYKQFEVNLFGVVRVTRVFMPLLRTSQGRVVNMVSILGRFSIKFAGIYAMTKHALIPFSDTLRREVSRFNVRVVTIGPAFFKTNVTDTGLIAKQIEENWSQSSDEVKKSYVNFDFEQKLVENFGKMIEICDKTDAVIDDLFDAIVNVRPKNAYMPIVGVRNRIEMLMAVYLPTDFTDKLVQLKEKLIIH